ncbi:Ger(x)C family spore germination protein [Cohnella hongkongensis]|uniref:Ger(X)C family spore germination protein n=1 Tax=Cohnella hongkongensis TaxID=178337 RepID=A0ABV9F8J0_9BACL
MKAAKAGIGLLAAVLTSGCWGQINFDQLTVVSAIGLDPAKNGRVRVTLQLSNPTLPVTAGGGSQARRPFVNYDAVGVTIQEAVERIQHQAKKSLFFPQTKVVLISEPFARRGLDDTLDYFWRETNQNLNSWVLVSTLPARHVLDKAMELESVPAEEWMKYLKGDWKRPLQVDIQMYQFLPRLNQTGFQAVSPGIGPFNRSGKSDIMEIGDTAIFKNDRMVGWLSGEESQIVNWLTGSSRNGSFHTDLAKEESVSFNLSAVRARMTPVLRDGRLSVNVRIRGEAEVLTATLPLHFGDEHEMLRDTLNKQLQLAVEETIDKLFRQYGSDVVGLGEALHRSHPAEWTKRKPRWEEELRGANARVSVSFRIRKSGLLH